MKQLSTRTTLGLWIALLMLILIGAASTLVLQNANEASLKERHSSEVQAALSDFMDLLQDTENGQRGFLLTGNPTYLEPYDRSADKVMPALQRIRVLTSDNPVQQRHLDQLEPLAGERMSRLANNIVLQKQGHKEAALAAVASEKGKELMDASRHILLAMQLEEQRLQALREDRTSGTLRAAFFLILLGSVALLIVVTGSTLKIQREMQGRQSVEDELRRNQERLRLAIEATHLGTWDFSPATGELHWDARCKALFGLPPDAPIDYNVFLAGLHPDDREATDAAVQQALMPGGTGEYDIEYRAVGLQDGITRWIRATGQAIFDKADGKSRAGRFIGTVFDITERKRQQSEIEALYSRLQRAFAESHHRIKNNLQVLAALVDMQRLNNSETVPIAELGRLSQHIRTLASLHDLLTQESRQGRELDTVSLKTALEKLVAMMQDMSEGRRIRLRAEEARLPLKQGGSFSLLANELISNAIKHGKGDIEVTLTASEAPSDASASFSADDELDSRVARLEVSDDGPGFPDGFDPTTAANTGLELIESMGRWDLQGQIAYENRPEGGASVVVLFPINVSTAETDTA